MNPSGNGQDFDSNNANPNNSDNNGSVEVFSREDSSQAPENNQQPRTEKSQQTPNESQPEQNPAPAPISEPQNNTQQSNTPDDRPQENNSSDEKPDFAMPQPEQSSNDQSVPEPQTTPTPNAELSQQSTPPSNQPPQPNQPLPSLDQPTQNQPQQSQPATNAQSANTQPEASQSASAQPANKKPEKAPKPPKAKSGSHTAEIALIVAIFVIATGAFGGGVFFWVQYNQLNSNVQSDRSLQVETAKKEQKDFDEKSHTKRTSSTTKEFTGPEDFGALNFQYPKDWNIFIANDVDDKPGFEAYFNPEYVQPVTSDKSTYAVHFKIQDENYDHVVSLYENNQDMQRIEFKNAQIPGVRYKGKKRNTDTNITEILIIKVNDKSAIFETNDYNTYQADFDNVITSLRNSNLSY